MAALPKKPGVPEWVTSEASLVNGLDLLGLRSPVAREMLSLSKLNWNNTQFDGGEPITVRAARRVGDILKCVPERGAMQPSFRFLVLFYPQRVSGLMQD